MSLYGRNNREFQVEQIKFGNYSFEIVKKKIKNIYFRVYPSKRKIIVSAPVSIDPDTLNKAILSKSDWLNKQVQNDAVEALESAKTYTTGETLRFKGKIYSLFVNYRKTRPKVFISPDNVLHLTVKPETGFHGREKVMSVWYRNELKRSMGIYIEKWQPRMGVTVNEFNVRKMKTRWGSCNINVKRIWLNLALIKLADPLIEYVVVHEMAHLLESNHNARFKGFMDQFIPEWKKLKKELSRFSTR